jgi:hypothetical protein
MLKSRIGNCGSDGLMFSYHSLTSERVVKNCNDSAVIISYDISEN